MKLEHDENVIHREIEADFAKEKAAELERKKNRGLGGHNEKPKTATKEEENDHKSFLSKLFGGLLSGITTVVGGIFTVALSSFKFLAGIVWKFVSPVKAILELVPKLFGIVGDVVGAVAGFVEKFVERFVVRTIFETFIPRIAAAFGRLISWAGKTAIKTLGNPVSAILGVSIAALGLSEAADLYTGLEEKAYTSDRSDGPQAKLDVLRNEKNQKLEKLANQYSGENLLAGWGKDPDTGEMVYGSARFRAEQKAIIFDYESKRSDLQKLQDVDFRDEVEPKLRDLGYTTDDKMRHVPPGSDGFSIPAIKKNGEEIPFWEYAMLATRLALTKTIKSHIRDTSDAVKAEMMSNPIVKGISDVLPSMPDIKEDYKKWLLETEKVWPGMKEKANDFMKVMADKGANMMPPVVTNETKTIPLPARKKNHINDYSIAMRTDDPTMMTVFKQNLRPV
jgi:hypothetical protein